jgi:hypothetical protein
MYCCDCWGNMCNHCLGTVVLSKTKKWANILMMFWGMMFAGVVGTIENTFALKILELALCISSFKPMNALIQ